MSEVSYWPALGVIWPLFTGGEESAASLPKYFELRSEADHHFAVQKPLL